MRAQMWACVATAAAMMAALGGCGGTDEDAIEEPPETDALPLTDEELTDEETSTTQPPTEPTTTTTTTEPPPPQPAYRVQFVNEEGWSYETIIEYPPGKLVASKDISTSPPGAAVLNIDLTEPVDRNSYTTGTNNEGRTGPSITPSVFRVYPRVNISSRMCVSTSVITELPLHGNGGTLCRTGDDGSKARELNEPFVDEFVDLVANTPEPAMLIGIGGGGFGLGDKTCIMSALVRSDGSITVEGDPESERLGCSLDVVRV